LLYPNAGEGEQALFPLADLDGALRKVSTAAAASRDALLSGVAPPGEDAAGDYNDHAFALPANAGYLPRKLPLAQNKLGRPQRFGRSYEGDPRPGCADDRADRR